ncbi:hypothetical protein ACTFIW_011088 [Dictyostelium discoideum]
MSTSKKIKTYNNKIFQDLIDFEILRSIINYLLTIKNNKNKNNNTSNQYKIKKFYFKRNEILNYVLVSKKWYNFISLTVSNNIINNKLFEYWLKINYNNNKSFIENYNNQNQYDKNNLIFKDEDYSQKYKISFNKKFSIIKIKESIINDYFKFNLFLDDITIDDFKEIKNKFENNQLLYNRIVVNLGYDVNNIERTLFRIHKYNLILILVENSYIPNSVEDDHHQDTDEGYNKKCTEIYFNNLSIHSNEKKEELGKDQTVKIFKILKGKNLYFNGSHTYSISNSLPHFDYSSLFDPDNSGQQVESIEVKNKNGLEQVYFVKPRHLAKVNQFENLHSITIPINSFQILSNLSNEMGFGKFNKDITGFGDSDHMKSELNQMINSFITCKSLKNLNLYISSLYLSPCREDPNDLNQTIESYSNSFKPLFSELNTSIERIELDCRGLLNINTFSNLLNNKSIKYLCLYGESDFIVYLPKQSRGSHNELISIDQYLFDNILSSPLTSIRHYKIYFIELNEIKFIFNLILNNIFKLQLYSLIFEFSQFYLIGEFIKEYKNLINNISIQQQQQQQHQQQKLNNINLIEFKIKIEEKKYIQELNGISNPYFTIIIKKINGSR